MAPPADTATTQRLTDQIADDLTVGHSVLLAGLPGSGRSHLADAVAAELSLRGASVTRVHGNRALVDRPLAALSLAGVDLEDPPPGNGGALLARTAATLGAQARRTNCVIIADDADDLDAASAGVIADVQVRRHVPVLIVCGAGTWAAAPVMALIRAAGAGAAVTLAGAPLEDVTHLTNHLLDGPVAADTISHIATFSGGLPGLITAIVQVGRRNGWLAEHDGVWAASGDLWDPALQFALVPFVRGLKQRDLDCLTRVAAARGADPRQAEEAAGAARVRRLTQRGLLHLDRTPSGASLHVFPPALAEWLRRHGGALVAAPGRGTAGLPDRPGGWRASLTGPEAAALTERFQARRRADVAPSWARWSEDPVPAHAVPLLAALLTGTAGDERIPLVFARTRRGDDDAAYTEFVVLTAVYRCTWEHDLPGALDLLDRHRLACPADDTDVRAIECRLILACDRVPDPARLALPEHGADGIDSLLAARAEAMIAQGRVDDAVEHLRRITARDGDVAALARELRALAMILDGEASAGVELAVEELRATVSALDPHLISGRAYVAGLGMTMLGRFDELEAVVDLVHRLAETSVFQSHLRAALFLLGAFVTDWQGRRDYARNLALQAKSLGVGLGPFPAMLPNQDLLFLSPVAPDRLWDDVDEMLGRGYLVAAVFLAVAAIERDPATARAAAVLEGGTASQSAVVRALTRYIATVNAADLSGFAGTVAQLREVCGPLDATRALITWALLLKERGDRAGWLERADAAWRESGTISRHCQGLFDRLVAAVDLTAREVEVASFVTVGLSSPEIANKLGVSARTVEAYLHSIFRKTGVNAREDLRHLTRTWLSLRS